MESTLQAIRDNTNKKDYPADLQLQERIIELLEKIEINTRKV